MALIEREGVNLYYEDRGGGDPAIVFVHGWTCDHTQFLPQADYFSPRHRVVLVDLRGHGRSDAVGPFDISSFAEDLSWLCGGLGLDRPVIVGHSMGGMIAVQFAALHPEAVRAVAALDSPFGRAGALQSSLEPRIAALKGPDHLAVRREMASESFGRYGNPEFARPHRCHCLRGGSGCGGRGLLLDCGLERRGGAADTNDARSDHRGQHRWSDRRFALHLRMCPA